MFAHRTISVALFVVVFMVTEVSLEPCIYARSELSLPLSNILSPPSFSEYVISLVFRISMVVPWGKALAEKLGDLSLIPRTQVVEGRTDLSSCPLTLT